MIRHIRSLLAWAQVALTLTLTTAGLWLLVIDRSVPLPSRWGFRGFETLFAVTSSVAGAAVISRQKRNAVGWLLLALGVESGVQLAVEEYAVRALLADPGSLPAGEFAAWTQNWIWLLAVGPFGTFLLLLFPTGRLLSPRWRPVAWLSAGALTMATLGMALVPGPETNLGVDNPYALRGAAPMALLGGGAVLLVAAMLLSAASLVLRLRRASGDERAQLKWFCYWGSLAVLAISVNLVPGFLRIQAPWVSALQLTVILTIGLTIGSVGVAILKYHLYDIDLIINRTLVYGPLTAVLAGTYVASVQLFRTLFVGLTGQTSDATVVLTTLVLASAFTPLKNGLQTTVDRRFKEGRDPVRDAQRFQERVRAVVQVIDPRLLTARLLDEAIHAFDAQGGAIYLGNHDQLEAVHVRGSWTHPQTTPSDAVVHVFIGSHDATLGMLALSARRDGHAYSDRDREALQSMAAVVAETIAVLDSTPRLGIR